MSFSQCWFLSMALWDLLGCFRASDLVVRAVSLFFPTVHLVQFLTACLGFWEARYQFHSWVQSSWILLPLPSLGSPFTPTHAETSERAQDKHSPGLLSKVSSAGELVGNSTGLYSVWVLSTDWALLPRYSGQADKLQGQSGAPVPKGSHPLLDQANIWMKKDTWVWTPHHRKRATGTCRWGWKVLSQLAKALFQNREACLVPWEGFFRPQDKMCHYYMFEDGFEDAKVRTRDYGFAGIMCRMLHTQCFTWKG